MEDKVMLILSGLPGSGKSTFANQVLDYSPNGRRINWDTMRVAIPNYKFSRAQEDIIVKDSHEKVRRYAQQGCSPIVIDNTNLNYKTINAWAQLAEQIGYRVVVQTFDTPLYECIRRDERRTGRARVGRPVIERMALWNDMIKWPTRPIVIVDVDGTLLDCSHRRVEKEKKCGACDGKKECDVCHGSGLVIGTDWVTFFQRDLMLKDPPKSIVVDWVRALYGTHTIAIVSGRPIDKAGDTTVECLENNLIPYDHIFMRQGGDKRDDVIVKKEILDKMPKDMIAFCIDDRNRVVDMWKENGLKCYQVVSREEGDF